MVHKICLYKYFLQYKVPSGTSGTLPLYLKQYIYLAMFRTSAVHIWRCLQKTKTLFCCCIRGWWENEWDCVCAPTGPPPIHWMYMRGPMWDQMLLLCCFCSHIFSNHYSNTSPPLLLNNQAYGPPCLSLCPQQMRRPSCGSSRLHMMKQPQPLISL